MKKLFALLSALFCVAIFPAATGCSAEPYRVRWLLESYVKDGFRHEPRFDPIHHERSVEYSSAQIEFDENGNFTFRLLGGDIVSGTYTYRDSLAKTTVELTAPSGATWQGECRKGMFDGVIYSAEFEMNGVKYCFDGYDDSAKTRYEELLGYSFYEEGIGAVRERLRDLCEHPHMEKSGGYVRATVEEIGGMYFLKTAEKTLCLSYCNFAAYQFDGEYNIAPRLVCAGECVAYLRESSVRVPELSLPDFPVNSAALYFPM